MFPDWLPWWAVVLIAIPAAFYVIALLLMPFSVFGVKGRLDVIDARLDELQGELRYLSLRQPGAAAATAMAEETLGRSPPPLPPARSEAPPASRRIVSDPPPRNEPDDRWADEEDDRRDRRAARRRPEARGPRSEPRLNWPR